MTQKKSKDPIDICIAPISKSRSKSKHKSKSKSKSKSKKEVRKPFFKRTKQEIN